MTRRISSGLSLAGIAIMLSGCSTLGGHVKGSFSCVAPDGVCAPSAAIDDRALALISGDEGDRMIAPAGPYATPPVQGRGFQTASAPARSRERVLRIVFPAQVDAAGRLHEQTAVHAVVQESEWQQTMAASAVATSPRDVAAAIGSDTLLAAVERADPPVTDAADTGAAVPTQAAVAAARAQPVKTQVAVSDPVGDIKDQVSRRLLRQRALPVSRTVFENSGAPIAPAASAQAAQAAGGALAPASDRAAARPPVQPRISASKYPSIAVPAHATDAGKAAIASIASNPAIRAGLARGQDEAGAAAKENTPLPVVRAAPFPGVDHD